MKRIEGATPPLIPASTCQWCFESDTETMAPSLKLGVRGVRQPCFKFRPSTVDHFFAGRPVPTSAQVCTHPHIKARMGRARSICVSNRQSQSVG